MYSIHFRSGQLRSIPLGAECFHQLFRILLWFVYCVCVLLSPVRLFATPWTVACQAPLFMEFSRQEYGNGLPFPSPVGSSQTRVSCIAGRFFTIWATIISHLLINRLIAIHVAPWIYYTLDYNSVLLYFVAQNSRKIVLVFFQKFWYFFPKTNHYFFKYFFSLFFHWRNNMLIESESEVTQSCLTLFDPMDCSLPGSSVHGIFQARVLEWVVIFFSKESSWPKDWTWVSCIAGRSFTVWATREA